MKIDRETCVEGLYRPSYDKGKAGQVVQAVPAFLLVMSDAGFQSDNGERAGRYPASGDDADIRKFLCENGT